MEEDGTWVQLQDPEDEGGDNNLWYEDKHFKLEVQDPRTPEEKKRELQRAAEELTYPLDTDGSGTTKTPDDGA